MFEFLRPWKKKAARQQSPPPVGERRTEQQAVPADETAVAESSAAFRVDDPLAAEVYLAFKSDQVTLPALPDVAARVRTIASDPNASLEQVAKVLQADMAIAAKLISVANSARFSGVSAISSCQAAVSRLGLKATQELTVSLALQRMFFARDSGVRNALKSLWEHSLLVSATAYELARENALEQPDEAMLGGLVHDIGTLAILHHINSDATRRFGEEEIERVVKALRAELGAMILRQWGFDERIVQCAVQAESHGWRSGKLEPVDLVIVAQAYSLLESTDAETHTPLLQLPVFKRLPMCHEGVEAGLQALLALRPRIDETIALFR